MNMIPIHSTYGVFTYISHLNYGNVNKPDMQSLGMISNRSFLAFSVEPVNHVSFQGTKTEHSSCGIDIKKESH